MATSMLLPLDIIVDLLIRLTSEESATIQVRSEVIPFGNQRPRFHQTPISIGSVETNSDRSLFLSVLNRGKWEWERSGVPHLFGTCGLFGLFVEWRRIEMTVVMEGVRRAGETRLKPAKQQKKRSEVEPGVAGDHTPTLKSELGYLRLESLQALGVAGKAGGPNCHNITLLADSLA
ncbi:hypothetical protein CUMW_096280 [Citrus unshiu]|uniref:Uncharacterized protein n=1 Tax=Citrus unshiu TaxID=55188 RepID=A0A2H5P2L1_CITUN|nr:hypothetical protein CUMW_096280 [Citrus unshiu]